MNKKEKPFYLAYIGTTKIAFLKGYRRGERVEIVSLSAQLAQSDMQVLLNLVAVYKSLGGGWEFAQESVANRQ